MKRLIVLMALITIACQKKEQQNKISFDWLIGNWQRTDDQPGKTTYEHWIKSGEIYLGNSYTIQANDTLWGEKIKLSTRGKNWVYSVSGGQSAIPTDFVLIQISKNAFVCENQQNEFPNIIRYKLNKHKLEAEIEGGEMKIPFTFKPVQP